MTYADCEGCCKCYERLNEEGCVEGHDCDEYGTDIDYVSECELLNEEEEN